MARPRMAATTTMEKLLKNSGFIYRAAADGSSAADACEATMTSCGRTPSPSPGRSSV